MPETYFNTPSIYPDPSASHGPRRVLITGAAGRIGSYFAEHSRGRYEFRLMVQCEDQRQQVEPYGEVVIGDLEDLDALKRFCHDMDAVVHLAANPDPAAAWSSLLPTNILGTYNLLVAAKSAGVARVICASSIHAVIGYNPEVQVKPDDPVNPGDMYGVTKCFAEAMGRYMADQEGLSVICLRIGAFNTPQRAAQEGKESILDSFVSNRDLNHLLQRCLDHPTLCFGIFHGLSDNRFKRLDISNARQVLGYQPQDDLAQLNPVLSQLNLKQSLRPPGQEAPRHGGIGEDL